MSTKQTLVERILALLNLTDNDRVKTFLERQVKSLKRDEKNLSKNIDTVTDQKVDELEKISDKIADAEEAVEAAYTNVTPEDVSTNEKADSFASQYWRNIERAEAIVMQLNKQYEQTEKQFDAQLEELQNQLKETKRRIETIS